MAIKRKRKRKIRGRKRVTGAAQRLRRKRLTERRLLRAFAAANKRGYTGMLHSKGGLYDDPHVIAAMRAHNRAVDES